MKLVISVVIVVGIMMAMAASVECSWLVNYQGVASSIATGYSKVRHQHFEESANRPVVGNERAFKFLQNPELGTEGPEPVSIFFKQMKNVKKVNFPDEIK